MYIVGGDETLRELRQHYIIIDEVETKTSLMKALRNSLYVVHQRTTDMVVQATAYIERHSSVTYYVVGFVLGAVSCKNMTLSL